MAEFVLNVSDIDETGRDYTFPVTQAWLGQALHGTDVRPDPAETAGDFSIHAQRQGRDLLLHGRLRSRLITECARCLADAHVVVDTPFGSLLTERSTLPTRSTKHGHGAAEARPEPEELELTPEDLERDYFSGDRVVLDDAVREQLLLEVPLKPLCREDCPGIPVPAEVAGPADLSASVASGGVDPRLAPLMKLVGKLEPTEE